MDQRVQSLMMMMMMYIMQPVVSGSTISESIKYVKLIHCSRDSVHSPVISSSGCWWNTTFPQVRIHRVLNSLQKWNSKLNANKRKGGGEKKNIHYEQTWRVPTLLNVLQIPWNTGSTSHTLSIPRRWNRRLHPALCTKKNIRNYLRSLFKYSFFKKSCFNMQLFFI